jgi:hypothetical protein
MLKWKRTSNETPRAVRRQPGPLRSAPGEESGDPDIIASKAFALLKLDRPKEALVIIDQALLEAASSGKTRARGIDHFRLGNYARSASSRRGDRRNEQPRLGHPTVPVVLVRAASEARTNQPGKARAAVDQFLALHLP